MINLCAIKLCANILNMLVLKHIMDFVLLIFLQLAFNILHVSDFFNGLLNIHIFDLSFFFTFSAFSLKFGKLFGEVSFRQSGFLAKWLFGEVVFGKVSCSHFFLNSPKVIY